MVIGWTIAAVTPASRADSVAPHSSQNRAASGSGEPHTVQNVFMSEKSFPRASIGG